MIEVNPIYRMTKAFTNERARERALSDAEIVAVWSAAEAEGPALASMFRLMILTSQRPSEIRELRWAEIDLEGHWWELPGERAKNGLTHPIDRRCAVNYPRHAPGQRRRRMRLPKRSRQRADHQHHQGALSDDQADGSGAL